ncbi:MAG: DUF6051 family protein [Paludibacteraceae bacterium]
MNLMNYSRRFTELNLMFSLGKTTYLKESDIILRFFPFQSLSKHIVGVTDHEADHHIDENLSFVYPVFVPAKKARSSQAILLLHGLNERNWNKYLTWAEYLCKMTGKPVILFPIAFHINRSPQAWSDPRSLREMLSLRRQRNGNDRSISFANLMLSERISNNPFRFYTSGRETLFDLVKLFQDIKEGNHALFTENCQIDIFTYSIGSFLAQITLMTDLKGLFSDSKLFMFCGGSIFSRMNGVSRGIMDKEAFEKMHNYYMNVFDSQKSTLLVQDKVFESFNSMISPERNAEHRTAFFRNNATRIKSILLKHDVVIPYQGVREALGGANTQNNTLLYDFPFTYTHENPFPVDVNTDSCAVDRSFNSVFSKAADFLAC